MLDESGIAKNTLVIYLGAGNGDFEPYLEPARFEEGGNRGGNARHPENDEQAAFLTLAALGAIRGGGVACAESGLGFSPKALGGLG